MDVGEVISRSSATVETVPSSEDGSLEERHITSLDDNSSVARSDQTDEEATDEYSERGGGDHFRSPYEYACNYFYGFLATTSLHNLQQCSAVQFVGMPRVGKSSAVAVQRGSVLSLGESPDGSLSYIPLYRKGDPKISHSTVAKTVNVTTFRDWQNKRWIIDTPGLNDNRSEPYRLWSNFSLETSYALAECIDATCVVIHYQSSFAPGANAESFRELAVALLANAGEDVMESFTDNMCFLFTHVGERATRDGVRLRLDDVHISYLEQEKAVLENLALRFKRNCENKVVDAVTGVARKGCRAVVAVLSSNSKVQKVQGKIDSLRARIDFNDARLKIDPLFTCLERIAASIFLLETIIAASEKGRLVLSRPSGRLRCQEQRIHLEKVFQRCSPLGRDTLRQLAVSRCSPSYKVYEIMQYMASQMQAKLHLFNEAMSTFLRSVEGQEQDIKSISEDWELFRNVQVSLVRDKIERTQESLDQARTKKDQIMSSRVLKAPPSNIHNAVKMKSSWATWLGLENCSHTVNHEGRWEKIEVEGNYGHHNVVEENDRTTVVVRSKWRHHLDARVMFLRHECDLDESKEKARQLESQIERALVEMKRNDEMLCSLLSATSSAALTDLIVAQKMRQEIADVRAACDQVSEQVTTSIFDESGKVGLEVDLRSACQGLYDLFMALYVEDAIPPAVARNGDWEDTMVQFVMSHQKYVRLVKRYEINISAAMLVSTFDHDILQSAPTSSNLDVCDEDMPCLYSRMTARFRRVQTGLTLTLLQPKDHQPAAVILCVLLLWLMIHQSMAMVIYMLSLFALIGLSVRRTLSPGTEDTVHSPPHTG